MLFTVSMTDDPLTAALARIEHALSRIESVAARPAAISTDSDGRYQALRTRTQAALASLETVIAQIGPNGART